MLHGKVQELDLSEIQLRDLNCLEKCSSLKTIRLQKSLVIKDGINKVLYKLPQLEVVHLQYNGDLVTDRTIESISKHCRKIRELDLGHCSSITDDGIATLRYVFFKAAFNIPD